MGMFDSVYFTCRSCGFDDIEVQSKAGECVLASYREDSVPLEIANDILDEYTYCPKCHNTWKVGGEREEPRRVALRLT